MIRPIRVLLIAALCIYNPFTAFAGNNFVPSFIIRHGSEQPTWLDKAANDFFKSDMPWDMPQGKPSITDIGMSLFDTDGRFNLADPITNITVDMAYGTVYKSDGTTTLPSGTVDVYYAGPGINACNAQYYGTRDVDASGEFVVGLVALIDGYGYYLRANHSGYISEWYTSTASTSSCASAQRVVPPVDPTQWNAYNYNFQLNSLVTYTVTTSTNPAAGGSVTGSGSYGSGETATLTATPANGYIFTGWSGDATGTSNPLYVTVNSNKNITANFSGPHSYSVTAKITDLNYGLDKDGDGYFETYSFKVGIDANVTPGPATVYLKITCPTTGQSWWLPSPYTISGTGVDFKYYALSQDDFGGNINENTNLDFTVEVWDSTKNSKLATTALVSGEPVKADIIRKTISPWLPLLLNKSTVAYTVTTSANPLAGGSVTGGGTYGFGETATLTAIPANGNIFTGWSGDATGTGNPLHVTVDSNKNITANFAQESSCSIPNGDFESGPTLWTEYSSHGWSIITNTLPGSGSPHSGAYAAWLGGDYDDVSYIEQQVTISSSCPYLTFYHQIASEDECGYDYGYVLANGTTVQTMDLCATNNTGAWTLKSIDLSAYAGQTVTLQIRSETDSTLNSNWLIDDASFSSTP